MPTHMRPERSPLLLTGPKCLYFRARTLMRQIVVYLNMAVV